MKRTRKFTKRNRRNLPNNMPLLPKVTLKLLMKINLYLWSQRNQRWRNLSLPRDWLNQFTNIYQVAEFHGFSANLSIRDGKDFKNQK